MKAVVSHVSNLKMKHVFLSYVREDSTKVDLIKEVLENVGITVWLDRVSLDAGQRWKYGIKKAIENGAFFIACFSDNYNEKQSTYMNEELLIAIEQLRLKPYDTSWFIPVRLTECIIPPRPIGGGEFLTDLQCVDLHDDLRNGVQKIVSVIVPVVSPREYLRRKLIYALESHINNKISHFQRLEAIRFDDTENRWNSLLEETEFEIIFGSFFELYERARSTGEHEIDLWFFPVEFGKIILLSVSLYQDNRRYLKSLAIPATETGNRYSDFIIGKKREARIISKWEERDFVHIIYFEQDDEVLFDILYLENTRLIYQKYAYLWEKLNLSKQKGDKIGIGWENMYPTSIISSIEATNLSQFLLKEEGRLIYE